MNNNKIAIATTTLYKNWYPGSLTPGLYDVDKIRGDLAIQTIISALECGYQIVVVDGGSSKPFREVIQQLNIKFVNPTEAESGMDPSRRQAFRLASKLIGVEIICWTEPEKISMVNDCLKVASMPIFNGDAAIVVPHRTFKSFETYPKFQAESEQTANNDWSGILRKYNILKPGDDVLDVFFGPKLFKNSPPVLSLFLARYGFDADGFSNIIFFPIISALNNGLGVRSVDVNYIHPRIQTIFEKDSPIFVKKRKMQKKQIVSAAAEFCRFLKKDIKSKIHK